MHVDRSRTRPARTAPEATFTGEVGSSGYFERDAPSRLAGATVTSAPGARTPWKVNPPDHAMPYIAVQEVEDGPALTFGARVIDDAYRKGTPAG